MPLSSSQPQPDKVLPRSGFSGSSLFAVARLDNFPAIATLWSTLWRNCSWNCQVDQQSLFQPTTMAAAIQLAMSASSFFSTTSVASKQAGPSDTQSLHRHTSSVVCRKDSMERQPIDVSRRLFAVAVASATALGVFVQPEAQAKRNQPAPPEEKKEEDKSLSAYDAKLLANAKRKEAMKAAVEAAKMKAKSIASAE